MKAYVVQDDFGDGGVTVQFATHAVTARRHGANELDVDFSDVSCRRARWADDYSPGPVPVKACIEEGGFWYECACGCSRRISSEGGSPNYDSDGDDGELNPMEPVYVGRSVYWNQGCKDSDDRQREEWAEQKRQDQATAEAAVHASFPFAQAITAYRGYGGQAHTYDALFAHFTFPGGEGAVNWEVGAPVVGVQQRDLAAWNALIAARKAATA